MTMAGIDDIQHKEDREKQGPVSYPSSVSAGPVRQRFAYPPTTTHMFGKRNSWTWPKAKMGQTDTDGGENSHWVSVR